MWVRIETGDVSHRMILDCVLQACEPGADAIVIGKNRTFLTPWWERGIYIGSFTDPRRCETPLPAAGVCPPLPRTALQAVCYAPFRAALVWRAPMDNKVPAG